MIARQLIWDGAVSLAVLDTTALVAEAIFRHGLSPLAAAALGRTLTATAYLCSWLKDEASVISVTVDGHGAGGKIRTAGDGALNLRGFVDRPDAALPLRADGKLDVGGFTGRDGTITVVRDDGEGLPFVGTSPLRSGELADDFSAYFLTSEQRPTAIALGVRIAPDGTCLGAGGVFLQPMPGAGEELLARTETAILRYAEVSRRIAEEGAEGIFGDFGVPFPAPREIRFRCRCSREKAASAVYSLGKEEAFGLLGETGAVRVHCHDCNTTYEFIQEDLAQIFGGGGHGEE